MVFDFDPGHFQGVLTVIQFYCVTCIIFIRLKALSKCGLPVIIRLHSSKSS